MIIHPFPQGSPAWHAARCGKITASATERYFAPDKRRLRTNRAGDGLATGAVTYLYELLAEWYFGVPADGGASGFMRRGTAMEDQARAAYEFHRMSLGCEACDVEQCGFIETDDHAAGCSVDGLVGDDGLVEIKCLSAREHLRMYHEGGGRAFAQAQAQMADTGRLWVDRFFYHPDPRLWIDPMRTDRDEDFIAKLADARSEVARRLQALQLKHLDAGFRPPRFDPKQWDVNGERVFTEQESADRIAELERKRAASGKCAPEAFTDPPPIGTPVPRDDAPAGAVFDSAAPAL